MGRAAILGSQAFQSSGNPQDALGILRKYYAALAQPAGDLAMAKAFAANGDPSERRDLCAARLLWLPGRERVNRGRRAGRLRLRAQLDDQYPPAMGDVMLARAFKLLDSGEEQQSPR